MIFPRKMGKKILYLKLVKANLGGEKVCIIKIIIEEGKKLTRI